MVQIEFLEVKLLNFVKIAHFCALRQIRVNTCIIFILENMNFGFLLFMDIILLGSRMTKNH